MTNPRAILLAGLLVLTSCTSGSPSSAEPTISVSAGATPTTSAEPTPTQAATQGVTPAPTAAEAGLAVDQFAEVVTTDLVVRTAPGTGGDSEIIGAVDQLPVFVVDGPIQADGYEWWLVVPEEPYTLEPWPSGWVAAGGPGEIWLAPRHVTCAAAPTSEDLWSLPSTELIGCHRGEELTLRGYLSGCSTYLVGAWESSCNLRRCQTKAACEGMADDRGIALQFDSLPGKDEGGMRVTGHFDDPLAQNCYVAGSALSALAVFDCRLRFVVTSYRFVE